MKAFHLCKSFQLQPEHSAGNMSLTKTLRKMDSSEMSEEGRSDTESPVGPKEPLEPTHGYVNLPTNDSKQNSDEEPEVPPPLVAKKDRSR